MCPITYSQLLRIPALVMLRHPVSFLRFQYPHTYRMFFSISPSIQGYCCRYSSHNAPFIRSTAHTIRQPCSYKSPSEKCMGMKKQKQETSPKSLSWNEERKANYGIESHLECNTLCFHLGRKTNAQNSKAAFHPSRSISNRKGGAEFMIDSCRGTNTQLRYG